MGLLADTRDLILGSGATVALRPALQYAAVRTDRPDVGFVVAGSDITANGLNRYHETLSATSKFFFRRGLAYKLTAGSFARVQGLLYASWRDLGVVMPPQEVVFQPLNESTAVSWYPLGGGRAYSTVGLAGVRAAVCGMGNLNTTMEWTLGIRLFNDPLGRGDWTALGSYSNPSTTNFEANTGEPSLAGLTLTGFQWFELALGVRKQNNGDTPSRCVFHVVPGLRYG